MSSKRTLTIVCRTTGTVLFVVLIASTWGNVGPLVWALFAAHLLGNRLSADLMR